MRILPLLYAGAILAAGSIVAPAGAVEGDADVGRVKAATCMGCHGIPGYMNVYPTYHVPRIGGQHAQYIVAALEAYRDGQRRHPTMEAQARSLSDQDIADIAAYVSGLGQ